MFRPKTLPSIEEAWTLPIPAELTSRQGAGPITQVYFYLVKYMIKPKLTEILNQYHRICSFIIQVNYQIFNDHIENLTKTRF